MHLSDAEEAAMAGILRNHAPVAIMVLLLALTQAPSSARVLDVPEDYSTIQAAVSAAVDLDTISIASGTYRGEGNREVDLGGRDLLICSREGPENTVIDCEQAGRAFYMDSMEHATIEGLTILNGMSAHFMGGGLFAQQATLIVRDCVFASCQSIGGGAVYLLTSTVTFEDCTFIGNSDHNQGGGAIWFIGMLVHRTLTCRRCVFTGNASTWDGMGGAICLDSGGLARFSDCTVVGNTSRFTGGIYSVDCDIALTNSIVRGNCGWDPDAGDDIDTPARTVTITCSNVNLPGIQADELVLGDGVIDVDPLFCDPEECSVATTAGDYRLRSDSPCLPGGNPCGVQMGPLGIGCQAPPPTGACCLPGGGCLVADEASCAALSGSYLGDQTGCVPSPCHPTPVQPTTWGRIKASFR
jgi:hypothetical protein